ncbi:hypothetical protein Tco_1305387 [Tanacetum coccineum]
MSNDPYFGIPILEIASEESSSSDVIPPILLPDTPVSEHISRWTKDHLLHNIIGELSRPVSIRLQLHEQALFCYYDAFLTSVEPKTYKESLTQSCWIEAMQEELNEFERLEVWELVPRPDRVMVITLNFEYTSNGGESKLDEDILGKAVDPTHYRGMVGTLMYLTSSRPDLVYVVCMCARYQARPIEKHIHAVKRIFRYLRGTVNRGLCTSGSMQMLGDRLVSWSSKRQKSAAISSTEAEYIALSGCCAQEQVENGVVELYFVRTEYQLAYIFTKALCRERIEFLIDKLRMRSFTPETLKELAEEAEE